MFQRLQLGLVLCVRSAGFFGFSAVLVVQKQRSDALLHAIMADRSRPLQQGEAVVGYDPHNVPAPEGHGGDRLPLGPQFGGFEKDHHQTVERVDFLFGQVVLGHQNVVPAYPIARPGQQAEMRILRVGAVENDFGGGPPRDGVQQHVLHGGEKLCVASSVLL